VEADLGAARQVGGRDAAVGGQPHVVEAAAVRGPRGAGVAGVVDQVGELAAAVEVAQVQGRGVGVVDAELVGEQPAVAAREDAVHRDAAVGREGVGVEQDLLGAVALADVVDGLLAVAVAAGVEGPGAAAQRGGDGVDVEQLAEALAQGVAAGECGEAVAGEVVLDAHPALDVGVGGVLEPAVGVGDGGAVQVLDEVVAAGRGRVLAAGLARGRQRSVTGRIAAGAQGREEGEGGGLGHGRPG
jgi:hypothetical protein